MNILCFDVGGSHVSAALCCLDPLQIIRSTSTSLRNEFSASDFVDLLRKLGREVTDSQKAPSGASVAVPGPFDFAAGVSYMLHKLEGLYGFDLRGALANGFGWPAHRLRFLNDASAFLLGEINAGAARGAVRAACLVLGTGVGSAFAVNGRRAADGDFVPPGGEIWNLAYGAGTVEDLLSTRSLKRDYASRTGKNLDVAAIAAAADKDPHARQAFEIFGLHLGQVIRDVLVPFSPEVVVLGGGISRSAHLFLPVAQELLTDSRLRLTTSTALDQAPLIGAAAYWRDGDGVAPQSIIDKPAGEVSASDAM